MIEHQQELFYFGLVVRKIATIEVKVRFPVDVNESMNQTPRLLSATVIISYRPMHGCIIIRDIKYKIIRKYEERKIIVIAHKNKRIGNDIFLSTYL